MPGLDTPSGSLEIRPTQISFVLHQHSVMDYDSKVLGAVQVQNKRQSLPRAASIQSRILTANATPEVWVLYIGFCLKTGDSGNKLTG